MEAVLSRLKALEERLASLEARLAALESNRYQYKPSIWADCGCPANNYVCGNAACPRAMRVTCAVSTKEIEN